MLGIFLDTETNGLNPLIHRIIDIAVKIVDVETGTVFADYQAIVFQPKEIWHKSDPASLAVNGYNYDIISQGKNEKVVATEILELFEKNNLRRKEAVFICQNPSFDRPFFSQLIPPEKQEQLLWPYHWLDLASMYWAILMRTKSGLPWKTGLSKDAIAAFFSLPKEIKPHQAKNGVDHLLLCYAKIIGFPNQKL